MNYEAIEIAPMAITAVAMAVSFGVAHARDLARANERAVDRALVAMGRVIMMGSGRPHIQCHPVREDESDEFKRMVVEILHQ